MCVFSKRSVRAGWNFLFGSRESRELTSDDISSSPQPAQTVSFHTSIFIPVLHRNYVALAPLVLVGPASVVLVVVDDAPASVQPSHVPPSVRTHAGFSRGSTHARSYARWVGAAAQCARVRILPPLSYRCCVLSRLGEDVGVGFATRQPGWVSASLCYLEAREAEPPHPSFFARLTISGSRLFRESCPRCSTSLFLLHALASLLEGVWVGSSWRLRRRGVGEQDQRATSCPSYFPHREISRGEVGCSGLSQRPRGLEEYGGRGGGGGQLQSTSRSSRLSKETDPIHSLSSRVIETSSLPSTSTADWISRRLPSTLEMQSTIPRFVPFPPFLCLPLRLSVNE